MFRLLFLKIGGGKIGDSLLNALRALALVENRSDGNLQASPTAAHTHPWPADYNGLGQLAAEGAGCFY